MQKKGRAGTSRAGKIALYGMMTALAFLLSYVETLIPINLGVPGVKLGLANLASIVSLYLLGAGAAAAGRPALLPGSLENSSRISASLACRGMIDLSFCSPSRGLTSMMRTDFEGVDMSGFLGLLPSALRQQRLKHQLGRWPEARDRLDADIGGAHRPVRARKP